MSPLGSGRGPFRPAQLRACLDGLGRSPVSTTGLDLQDLEAEPPPEVMPPGVALVLAAPGGPVKAVVKGLVVVAGQVDQAADLADAQRDQVAARAIGWRLKCFGRILPDWGFRPLGCRELSTGCATPF